MIGNLNVVGHWYLISMWFVGTPLMIIFICVYAFMGYAPVAEGYFGTYGEDAYKIYPEWTDVIGL